MGRELTKGQAVFHDLAIVLGGTATFLIALAALVAFNTRTWELAILFASLAAFGIWAVRGIRLGRDSTEYSLGGRAALMGYLIGSICSLYPSASSIWQGQLSGLTTWQAACWAFGNGTFIIASEAERQAVARRVFEASPS